jgi:hypothetical protein
LPVRPTGDRQDRAKRFVRRDHDLVSLLPIGPESFCTGSRRTSIV